MRKELSLQDVLTVMTQTMKGAKEEEIEVVLELAYALRKKCGETMNAAQIIMLEKCIRDIEFEKWWNDDTIAL